MTEKDDENTHLPDVVLVRDDSSPVGRFEQRRQEAIDLLRDDKTEGFILSATQDWEEQTVIYGDKVPEIFGHGELIAAAVVGWIDQLLEDGIDPDEVRKLFMCEMAAIMEARLRQ